MANHFTYRQYNKKEKNYISVFPLSITQLLTYPIHTLHMYI